MFLIVLTSAHCPKWLDLKTLLSSVCHKIWILFYQMKESHFKPTMKKTERNLLDLSTISLQRCLSQDNHHLPVISGLLVLWSSNSLSDKYHSKEKLKIARSNSSKNVLSPFQKQFQRKQLIWSQNFSRKYRKIDWEQKTSKMLCPILFSWISTSRKSVLLYLLKNSN